MMRFDEEYNSLTFETIIDRLVSVTYNKTDDNIIPVFLIFYRKFMKPNELVKILIDRFENDRRYSASLLPTALQKRIHSIFSLWLSHYWNDFYGDQTRKTIISFLDRISKYENLTPICDSLAPLVIREPPVNDPDNTWGLVDDDDDDDDDDDPLSSLDTCIERNKKKDSGYSSGGVLCITNFIQDVTNRLSLDESSHLLTSNNNVEPNLDVNTPTLSSNYLLHHAKSNPLFLHPNLRKSQKKRNSLVDPNRCCAEFAGGLINIDHIAKYDKHNNSTPSIATTIGWASSILGYPFSTIKQHPSFNQVKSNYKTFIKLQNKTIADQLTWIEAELFSRIKPREFIQHLWTSKKNDCNQNSSNNAVIASIAHFNFISAWITTTIIEQSSLTKRILLLEKFMSIAVELQKLNNYNSLMAFLAGINSASILRLKQTRQAIITKKVYKQFRSLERLMNTEQSYSSYRLVLNKALGTPGIPYLGIHSQDLVLLTEANKDFRANGTIHWEKFRLMGETIMTIMKFKYPRYTIEPDIKVLRFIADSQILTEDEQYKKSIIVEPRVEDTLSIKSLWIRL